MIKVRGFEKVDFSYFQAKYLGHFPKQVYEDIVKPKRGTARSAGYDFFAPFSFTLYPGEEIVVPTGIKVYMQTDEFLDIRPRSGQGFKYLRVANTTGIIDSDYYDNLETGGHIMVKVRNESHSPRGIIEVEKGKGFCQGIFMKYLLTDGDDFIGKERIGGFGSTDEH
jgi:dUTP pyrophosphatase